MAGSLILLLVVTGCKDFFGTEDLKETIREDAQIATAAEVQVVLRAERDTMGTPSPYGTQTVKVGVPYEITTTVGQNYSFLQWTHSGEDGVVEFADATAISTTMTVTQEVSDLLISPTFDRRPYPVTWDPYSGNTGVYTNKTITLTFNEAVDDTTVALGEGASVEVSTWSQTGGAEAAANPEHIEDTLTMSVDGSVVTLAPIPGQWFSPYHAVLVELRETIADAGGNTMAEPFSWFFYTGAGRDSAAPVLTRFAILRNDAEVFDSEAIAAYTNDTEVQIIVSAQDEDQVPYLKIIETFDGGDPIETELTYSTDPIPYTMNRTTDGDSTIQVQVADTFKNWSTADVTLSDDPDVDVGNTKTVTLDTAAPTVSGFSVGSAEYTNTRNVSVTPGTANGTGTDLVGWKLSASSATPSSWESSAPTTMTLSTGDGTKTVYLHVRDAAGNTGYVTDTIVLDSVNPSAGTVVLDGGTSLTTDTSITLSLSGEDGTGSSIKEYRVTGDVASPTGWVTSLPSPVELDGTLGDRTVTVSVRDQADNEGSANAMITFDNAVPSAGTVVLDGGASHTADTSVTLVLSGADGTGSDITHYRVTGDISSPTGWVTSLPSPVTLTGGEGAASTVIVEVRDEAGYEASASATIVVDTIAPSAGTVLLDGGAGYTADTSVTLALSGQNGTGSSIVQYRVTGEISSPTGWVGSLPSPVTITGAHGTGSTVTVEVRDQAGNTGSAQATITLDSVNPSAGTVVLDGGTSLTTDTSITLSLSGEDGTGSSIKEYRVTGDVASPTGWVTSLPSPVELDGTLGDRTVTVSVRDQADNEGSANAMITFDNAVPSAGTVVLDGGASHTADTSVTLVLSGADGTGSDITHYRVTGDISSPTGWVTSLPSPVTLTGGEGAASTVIVEVRDEAGYEASAQATITLDTSSPTITGASLTATLDAGSKVDVTGLSTQDPVGGSGINVSEYTATDGTFNGTELLDVTDPGDGNSVDITITAEDNVGNPVSAVVRITNTSGSYTAELNP